MRKLATGIAAAFLLLATGVHAQSHKNRDNYRYGWRDAQGHQHYSDSLTRGAIRNGYQVINNQGMVVRTVAAPMDAKQRAAAKAKADRAEQADRARKQKQQADRQLLDAYPTEQSFADAQQAQLDNLDQTIGTTKLNLKSQEENLTELLGHAADIQDAGNKVPARLSQRIAKQRAMVAQQRTLLQHQRQERKQAKKHAQEQLQHYRKLKAQLNAEVQGQ